MTDFLGEGGVLVRRLTLRGMALGGLEESLDGRGLDERQLTAGQAQAIGER